MTSLCRKLVACALSSLFCGPLYADQSADEAAVRSAAKTYAEAFNAHDAASLAAHWSPDAVYQNPLTGEEVAGRKAIESQFAEILSELPQAKLQVAIDSVQFVSPNVAIERGTARVVRPDAESHASEYTAVHVKRDGKWLLDRVTEEDSPAAPSSYERLKDLEWMVGVWVDQDEHAQVETTCQWAKNQSFLTRAFTISIADRIELSGMQFIGWDPTKDKIRSWVFDSDGGFGEATWNKKDNRWVIEAAAVLPDGRRASAVNIMTITGDNSFTWQSIGRELDGEILPNVEPVDIVRLKTADGQAATPSQTVTEGTNQ